MSLSSFHLSRCVPPMPKKRGFHGKRFCQTRRGGGGRWMHYPMVPWCQMMTNDSFPYIREISNEWSHLRRQGTKRRQLIIFMICCSSHVFTITNTFVREKTAFASISSGKAKNKRGGPVWKGVHRKCSRFKMEGGNSWEETMLGG